MIRYWIVGVLDSPDPHHGALTVHSDVVWMGARTKSLSLYRHTKVADTSGRVDTKIVLENPDDLPYAYSSRRHAQTALTKLVGRGEGFFPLRNVHSLTVKVVEYRSDGRLYEVTRSASN